MKPYRLLISFVLTASIIIASLLDGSAFDISETDASWADSESISASTSSGTSFVQAMTRTSLSHHLHYADYSKGDIMRINFRRNLWRLSWRHGSTEAANIIMRNDPATNNMRNTIRAEDIEIRYEHLHGVRMDNDFRWELYHLTGEHREVENCVSSNASDIRATERLIAYSDNLNEFTPVNDVVVGGEGGNAYHHLCFIFEHKGNNPLPNGHTTKDDPTSFNGQFFVDLNTTVGRDGQPGGKEWSQAITARIDLSNI